MPGPVKTGHVDTKYTLIVSYIVAGMKYSHSVTCITKPDKITGKISWSYSDGIKSWT